MVLGSLFLVKAFISDGNEIKARLQLVESHEVFAGHFPGQPVVPGVCMMQAVKELAERQTGKKLSLVEADNMKFLSVLDPRVNSVIDATINVNESSGKYVVNATLFAGTVTFFKLKAVLNIFVA